MNHLRHALKHLYIAEAEYQELIRLANRARGASTGWLAYLDSCPPNGPAPHARMAGRRTERRTPNVQGDPESSDREP